MLHMKPGTLVRLGRGRALYNTITVQSNNEGRDMVGGQAPPRVFTIRPGMIGMCIVAPTNKGSGHFLFDDVLVWVEQYILEPLEQTS
jgi:hypothetical protein